MTVSTNLMQFAASAHSSPPDRLGQRYDATRFLPEAGNTVVCHLDRSDPAHAAVLDARTRMMALQGAECFLHTPIDSLHMTVFEGAIETRRRADAWPDYVDQNAPIEEATEATLARLAGFTAPPAFKVRVIGLRPTGLVLAGATGEDEARMRIWREALTKPFGYRHDNHDEYHFHMTFAYPIAWLPDALVPVWEEEFQSILADLTAAAPVIPLNPPAYCRFADMTWFEELLVL